MRRVQWFEIVSDDGDRRLLVTETINENGAKGVEVQDLGPRAGIGSEPGFVGANVAPVDTGVWVRCTRCRSRWRENDPAALAGIDAGYGVQCPKCGAVVKSPGPGHRA